MAYIMGSPGRYIQGEGVLQDIGRYGAEKGKHLFVLLGEWGREALMETVGAAGKKAEIPVTFLDFTGECCMEEIGRIEASLQGQKGAVLAGIGSGKLLDTAKAVGAGAQVPVILVPTIASSDAPCSAISVLYTRQGEFLRYLHHEKGPDLVLVDSATIISAPVRLLAAGMGDALSTWYEARACAASGAVNEFGGQQPAAALALARGCAEILFSEGEKAFLDAREKKCTSAVEHIIEVNTLLSGIGFESGGLAAAHAIQNALSCLKGTEGKLHGEKVAFGVLVQLVLEEAWEDFDAVQMFCRQVELPLTFEALGAKDPSAEELERAGKLAVTENGSMGNMPFPVSWEQVVEGMKKADRMGEAYKKGVKNDTVH